MPKSVEKELRDALEPFARVYRILEQFNIDPNEGMRDHMPGAWPRMSDCQRANELLVKLKHRF